MASTVESFKQLHRLLLEKGDYFKGGPVKTPPVGGEKPKIKQLRRKILAGAKALTPKYREGYSNPLHDNLEGITNTLLLKTQQPDGFWGLLYLANAAIQPAQGSGVAHHLQRLQAVISDIYISFLHSRGRAAIGLPLQQRIPPLGAFTAPIDPKRFEVSPPPYMVDVDTMKTLSEQFTTGVVSVPSGYMNHPILWGILAHEVGGHDVLHADDHLLPQLLDEIEGFFSNAGEKILGPLWRYWGEEAASDVCGLLNLGPAYGLGAIVFYTVIAHIAANPKGHEANGTHQDHEPILENKPNPNFVDRHPVPVLIPHLIIGALEQLSQLTPATRLRCISQLEEMAKLCTGSAKTVQLSGYVIRDHEGKPIMQVEHDLPLDRMQEWARKLGGHIANVKLPALNGKSLQALETWDDADERSAQLAASRLQSGKPLKGVIQDDGTDIDDAQLLAGAILAVFRQPSLYDQINRMLGDALDDSYDSDPLLHPHLMDTTRTSEKTDRRLNPESVTSGGRKREKEPQSNTGMAIASWEAGRRISGLLRNIRVKGLRYTILHQGKPVAVLGPIQDSPRMSLDEPEKILTKSRGSDRRGIPSKRGRSKLAVKEQSINP